MLTRAKSANVGFSQVVQLFAIICPTCKPSYRSLRRKFLL